MAAVTGLKPATAAALAGNTLATDRRRRRPRPKLLGALWYVTTDSFQAYVRRRMVAEVERITGGRAEIGSFHVIPFRMQVEVRDIIVHGKEAPGDVPLAHADHLIAQVKVISLLRTEFGFYSLSLEHPIVHIAVAADGTTNVPALRVLPAPSQNNLLQPLFALSIDHLAVRNGQLLWADQTIPPQLQRRRYRIADGLPRTCGADTKAISRWAKWTRWLKICARLPG